MTFEQKLEGCEGVQSSLGVKAEGVVCAKSPGQGSGEFGGAAGPVQLMPREHKGAVRMELRANTQDFQPGRPL